MSVRSEEFLYEQVEICLGHKAQLKERKTGDQLSLGGPVPRESAPDQENAVHVVRVEHIGYEATIDDQPQDSSAASQVDEPTQ